MIDNNLITIFDNVLDHNIPLLERKKLLNEIGEYSNYESGNDFDLYKALEEPSGALADPEKICSAWLLGKRGGDKIFSDLVGLLKNGDYDVQYAVTIALLYAIDKEKLNRKKCIESLKEGFEEVFLDEFGPKIYFFSLVWDFETDPAWAEYVLSKEKDPFFREKMFRIIGEFPTKSNIENILIKGLNDNDAESKYEAAFQLVALNHPGILKTYYEGLQGKVADKLAVSNKISGIPSQKTREFLRGIIHSKSKKIVLQSINSIGLLGVVEDLYVLLELLASPDKDISDRAFSTIEFITGLDLPYPDDPTEKLSDNMILEITNRVNQFYNNIPNKNCRFVQGSEITISKMIDELIHELDPDIKSIYRSNIIKFSGRKLYLNTSIDLVFQSDNFMQLQEIVEKSDLNGLSLMP